MPGVTFHNKWHICRILNYKIKHYFKLLVIFSTWRFRTCFCQNSLSFLKQNFKTFFIRVLNNKFIRFELKIWHVIKDWLDKKFVIMITKCWISPCSFLLKVTNIVVYLSACVQAKCTCFSDYALSLSVFFSLCVYYCMFSI